MFVPEYLWSDRKNRKREIKKNRYTRYIGKYHRFYCPYKQCGFTLTKCINILVNIIRVRFSNAPNKPIKKKRHGEKYQIRNRNCISFDRNLRKMILNEGGKIINNGGKEKSKPFYCPYKGCIKTFTEKKGVFQHIRREHDSDFRKNLGNQMWTQHKTESGEDIEFNGR
ncbi:hypothetical protein BDA99DRAFT_113124 [Phascolomyces articulosus]|uniref:C2H2-type domain-containing protein n=1 Tax=Phascolomyces articulosus TaxID=60185 RepID=A0AAD5JWT5_9FUNG|nr:hypothetical protein BDA99DRAFT_113124 [Phascolomyces articulosus]